MAISDILLGLFLTPAVLAVIADLAMDRSRRQAAAFGHEAWWDALGEITYSRLLAQAAVRFMRFPEIHAARGRPYLRFMAGGIAATSLAGVVFMAAGIALFASVPKSVAGHALSYFAVPGIALAVVSLVLGLTLFARIARASSLFAQLSYVVVLAAGTVALWLLLMSLGTWLEWQEKATPTVFGSEWFLAKAYMEYVREPPGRLISLTAALIVGLPAAPYIVQICLSMGCKSLRPILAPGAIRLIKNFADARPGAYALWALLFIIPAGLFRLTSGAL